MHNSMRVFVLIVLTIMALPWSARAAGAGKDAGTDTAPVVTRALMKNAPAPFPYEKTEVRARCFHTDIDMNESPACFVVKYRGLTYWPLAFDDNRMATLMAGYDAGNNLVTKVYACDTRYIWYISVDEKKRTVTIWGQHRSTQANDPGSTVIPWELLRVGGRTCYPR